MNKNILYTLCVILLTGILSGCKKDRLDLEPPSSKLEGINDTWVLQSVVQIDEADALFPEMDVSETFIGTNPMQMRFNSETFSYEVAYGDCPNYFGDNGTWAFDDNEFPTLIELSEQGNTHVLNLLRTVRTVDKTLEFHYFRTCDAGKKVVSYQMIFERKK